MTAAVILAGGLGTRLRSVVPDLPKPMAPVSGRPFLEHLIDHWISQGIDRFILSVGFRHELIIKHFLNQYRGIPIEYSIEDTPLGTGGALLRAGSALAHDERFVLLNGDTFFDVCLEDLHEHANRLDADWCFSLFRAHEPGRFMGMRVNDDTRITGLQHDNETVGRLANGGVYLVHPRALNSPFGIDRYPVSLESELFPAWLEAGQRFFGLPCDGSFIDIGVPHDYLRAGESLHNSRGSTVPSNSSIRRP